MNRHARTALLLALLGGVLLVTAARTRGKRQATEARFASAEELLRLAGEDGLVCHDGSRAPLPWSGHFVTDRPRDRVELDRLCKGCCGQWPAWDGVLWVRGPGPGDGSHHVSPPDIGGNRRTLGRVLVAGDERLIKRIEDTYRRRADGRGGR